MELEKLFGENVRRFRQAKGLSQEEFAHQAGLHTTYVSGVENGHRNPTVRVVAKIASALEIEPAQLFLKPE